MPTPDDFNRVNCCKDPENKQFSSDVTGNPEELLQQTRACVDQHADLIQVYGYHQPIATLGSHPWLRDELTNTGEMEPGNAEPKLGLKIPK